MWGQKTTCTSGADDWSGTRRYGRIGQERREGRNVLETYSHGTRRAVRPQRNRIEMIACMKIRHPCSRQKQGQPNSLKPAGCARAFHQRELSFLIFSNKRFCASFLIFSQSRTPSCM